jgi:integrator complex subunit 9
VLKWKSVQILLDCNLELSKLLKFLIPAFDEEHSNENEGNTKFKHKKPKLKEDIKFGWIKQIDNSYYIQSLQKDLRFCTPEFEFLDLATIDVVLISNFYNILALPFITEHIGFKGKIYATEPTVQMGRYFIILYIFL